MRLLVTRPEPEASRTAEALRARGHEAIIAPALEIVADRSVPLPAEGVQAVVATSANAPAALAGRPDATPLLHLPFLAVGGATARAARRAGFDRVVSADGAVGDLAATVARSVSPEGGALLYVAGRDRTGDLEGLLERAGFAVRLAEVYRAEPARVPPAEARAALLANRVDGVLIFSKRSAETVVSWLTELRAGGNPVHVAVHAISEAAAEPFLRAGFERVRVAARPNSEALFESLERND
ncbi:uroporphyrinogen-III synthase [Prosthecomicrobium sp. N25]|uniref:uroporphyrinogen-III synthase n=1 Tax=Prosthecomicrobium sp. N25 TaxID=3129254 RepID=UPI0030776E76